MCRFFTRIKIENFKLQMRQSRDEIVFQIKVSKAFFNVFNAIILFYLKNLLSSSEQTFLNALTKHFTYLHGYCVLIIIIYS